MTRDSGADPSEAECVATVVHLFLDSSFNPFSVMQKEMQPQDLLLGSHQTTSEKPPATKLHLNLTRIHSLFRQKHRAQLPRKEEDNCVAFHLHFHLKPSVRQPLKNSIPTCHVDVVFT